MKNALHIGGLVAGLLAVNLVQAQVGATGSIGTNGLGFHLNTPLGERLQARLGMNLGQFSTDGVASQFRYDADVKGRTVDALLDYFPAGRGFRISAGLIYNDNKVDIVGRPDIAGSFNLNGVTYTAAQIVGVNGQIKFKQIVPYLGIGWGSGTQNPKGWSFAADVGVMFQGTPTTSLNLSNCLVGPLCPFIQENLNAEAAALNREADNYKYFPVLRAGLTYRF